MKIGIYISTWKFGCNQLRVQKGQGKAKREDNFPDKNILMRTQVVVE